MSSISELMTSDHRSCDEIYANAEQAIDEGNFEQALSLWNDFCTRVEKHFSLEEESLFPAFEEATGMRGGPTMVMRGEHLQMREMFKSITAAIESKDADDALGQCESLMIFMQQHNMKEEQVLYPMLNDTLPEQDTQQKISLALAV
ncbi:hemerythrin domain-containing protein [Alkalimarinus sediminis]|uniref:Hemerythrin domain-containing protein n=1 Tax=Alkalimarinus sediminis TaxID=1632866 RepID=A0A9E8HK18_9ALTE|nr:hemerythrin domain-containing protein [Alkalimarinus sediminis]UZW74191.1 hemerythrin domain-containing protein [Alkalimarinus sediminis]